VNQNAPFHVIRTSHVHFSKSNLTVSRHTYQSRPFYVYLSSNRCVLQQIRIAAEKSRELEKKNLMKELSSNMREEDDEFQRKLRRYCLTCAIFTLQRLFLFCKFRRYAHGHSISSSS